MNNVQSHVTTTSCLADLVSICEQMLERASQDDWAALEKLEQDRVSGLTRCLADLDMSRHGPAVTATLGQMIDLNEQLVTVVSSARNKARDVLTQHQSAQLAVTAYSSTTRS